MKKVIRRLIKALFPEYFIQKQGGFHVVNGNRIGVNTILDHSTLGINNSIGANGYLYNSKIGDFTYLGPFVAMMNTQIGKFCSIAQGVGIGLGEHPAKTFVSTHPVFFSPHKQCGYSFTNQSHFQEMGENIIGNDVWIGLNAIIMNNITVADGAIIGAGAIVTKDVPPYAVVAGSPAKIIKFRFNEDEIERLLRFRWWNKDYAWIEQNFRKFHNIDDFLSFISEQQ